MALPWVLVLWPEPTVFFQETFAPWCHQLPERTLNLSGIPMVVCSRCVGIYSGIGLGVWWPRVLSTRAIRWGLVTTFLLVLSQVVLQEFWLGIHHAPRLATGAVVGLAMGVMLGSALSQIKRSRLTEAGE